MTDQVDISTPAVDISTPAVEAKSNLPKRVAAVLLLKAEGQPDLKVAKYPMPVKAPRFDLSINGTMVPAATTGFKDKSYTYFQFNGVDFYVSGALSQEPEYTFQFPEGYEFKALKLDRKAAAVAAAAKAKAKKAEGADQAAAGEESPPAGVISKGEGEGSPATADAAAAPSPKGKKAKR